MLVSACLWPDHFAVDIIDRALILPVNHDFSIKSVLSHLWNQEIEIEEISMTRPSLEDAFLKLTNNSMEVL